MGNYAIVCDASRSNWWVQGDEGRVPERPLPSPLQAHAYACGMAEEGLADVDLSVYFVDAGEGPDWHNPIPMPD